MRTLSDDEDTEPIPDDQLPGLFVSLLPVILPVIMIAINTGTETVAKQIGEKEFKLYDSGDTPSEKKAEILAAHSGTASGTALNLMPYTRIIGNPNLALLISTIIALWLLYVQKGPSLKELADIVEISLMSGGVIILITAGGFAFGASLKMAEVGEAIESYFSPAENSASVSGPLAFEENRITRPEGDFVEDQYVAGGSVEINGAEDVLNNGRFEIVDVTAETLTVRMEDGEQFVNNPNDRNVTLSGKSSSESIPGMPMLFLCFGVAALIKVAQGSSTSAMIITSSMVAPMVTDPAALGFHPVYLATAIGSGSLVGSWMNDSGFWIFAKMGGLTESECLKSWTIMLVVLGLVSMAVTLLLVQVMPLASAAV